MREALFPGTLVALLAISNLIGCQPFQREQRIALHPHTYKAATQPIQELIGEGRVRRGMTREEVYLALGVPEEIAREVGSSDLSEEWSYQRWDGADFTLFFRRGVLHHIQRDIDETPSAGEVAACNRLLETLTLDDLEPVTRALASREAEAGSVTGTVTRRTSYGTAVAVAEQRVTLLPRYAAWAEAEGRIREDRRLRDGLARYTTLREVGRYIKSATPKQFVMRQRTDGDGRFLFTQMPPGEWMLTVDYHDDDGLHLWWIPVSVSSSGETALTLNNANLTASYPAP